MILVAATATFSFAGHSQSNDRQGFIYEEFTLSLSKLLAFLHILDQRINSLTKKIIVRLINTGNNHSYSLTITFQLHSCIVWIIRLSQLT